MKTVPREAQVPQAMVQALVAHGLRRLPAEAPDLPADLADDIRDAREILIGQRQLAHRLAALAFVFRDAGGFFKDRPAFFRLGGKNLVDLTLRHDRVTRPADAGIHEKLLDILQAASLAVKGILALPVAKDPARDLDFVKFAPKLLLAIGEQERDFAQLCRFPGVGTFKDDVLHLTTAEGLGALLPEHPADRIGDIGFTAAVGPHDRRYSGLETERCRVGKGLETVQF